MTEDAAREGEGALPRPPRLLVVDDSPTQRAHIRALLGSRYGAVLAPDGEQGLAEAMRAPPDLILSDVTMPGMDGYELCRRVRAEPRLADVPFILMTSNQDPDGRAVGLEGGADDFLSKSCSQRELLARVSSLLRLREARLQILRQKEEVARAHEELLAAQKQLFEAEKLATLGTVAAGVAHELNNPLAFVLAGVEQLAECCRELAGARPRARPTHEVLSEVGEVQGDISQGAERIKRIIRDMNLLASDPERRPVWVDSRQELERALTIGQSRLIGATVRTSFESVSEVRVTPGYLTQIALTLLTNAADAVAGKAGGAVMLATRDVDDQLELTVSDNGPGISSELLPRIFEPFFSTKPAGRGTGLGLSVCSGLVKRLGGALRVTSEPGSGCKFVVTFPRQMNDAQTDFMKSRVESVRQGQSTKA